MTRCKGRAFWDCIGLKGCLGEEPKVKKEESRGFEDEKAWENGGIKG